MSPDDGSTTKTVLRLRGEIEVSMQPSLVVLHGAELGRRLELLPRAVTIGRGPDCDLVADMVDLSREHCRIVPVDDGFMIIDAGSTNGTFVDGHRLAPGFEFSLQGGERIRLGSLILKFLDGRDVEALYHEEIYRLTITDGLTGLHNRRHFDEAMETEIARWRRYQRPLSLILLDIDDFKTVNDEHGHPGGDEALQQLAAVLKRMVRQETCLVRLSGDEFAIGLPETPLERALIVAERVRGEIEQTDFVLRGKSGVRLTVSLGVSEMTEELWDRSGLLQDADRKLYEAKQLDRNRVIA